MTIEEAQKAQRFILRLIGNNLEQIAIWKIKLQAYNGKDELSKNMISYYKDWKEDLESMYLVNVILIKQHRFELVQEAGRRNPPDFV